MSRAFCAAADWGTSSFRFWLMDHDGNVLAERRSDEGMAKAAETGFVAVLSNHLGATEAPRGIPVVICGMAGARQGWREAPYLETPAPLRDLAAASVRVDGGEGEVRILPGIAHRDPISPDVMRGEETQLLALSGRGISETTVCLPGTHSKWVRLAGGRVESFATFMTGELFSLIAGQSILRHSLRDLDFDPRGADFADGVRAGLFRPQSLTSAMFGIRAGDLLQLGCDEPAARLSGLLIGSELAASLPAGKGASVVLVSSGRLARLYEVALGLADVEPLVLDAEEAVRRGLFEAAAAIWGGGGGK